MPLNAPDVYVQEQSGLLAPELSVADTVAAFIGHTEKGPQLTPTRIRSLREYEKLFGQAELTRFDVAVDTQSGETANYTLTSLTRVGISYVSQYPTVFYKWWWRMSGRIGWFL